jgi:putative cell wall-binding protein
VYNDGMENIPTTIVVKDDLGFDYATVKVGDEYINAKIVTELVDWHNKMVFSELLSYGQAFGL